MDHSKVNIHSNVDNEEEEESSGSKKQPLRYFFDISEDVTR